MEILIGFAGVVLGTIIGVVIRWVWATHRKNSAEAEATRIVEEAKIRGEQIKADGETKAKQVIFEQREKLEDEIRQKREEVKENERRLEKREDTLDKKFETINKKEEQLEKTQQRLTKQEEQLQERYLAVQKSIDDQQKKLMEIAGYSRETAEAELFRRLDNELSNDVAERMRRHEAQFREKADVEATNILAEVMERLAVDYTTEHVVTTVELPSDDMKGRIIGREGRNIRAFEKATGIDVIVDDTPGVVVLSGFDSVRREIARLALIKLIGDGRIHPTRIEEIVQKTQEEMEKHIIETGKAAAEELDVKNLRPREVFLLGRLKYRTSYGQNVLDHSREVGFLAGMIAAELKLDEEMARRAGLLHDIGKGVDHEEEGTHPTIGMDVAKRCEENPLIVNAIGAHHEDIEPESLYATLVQIADAISASRPGARRETLEKYIKRLEKLESIANSKLGVEKAYAIQAGREIRVIAQPDKITEVDAQRVVREIAQEIERDLTYPGEIKITLIRESRFVEYAR